MDLTLQVVILIVTLATLAVVSYSRFYPLDKAQRVVPQAPEAPTPPRVENWPDEASDHVHDWPLEPSFQDRSTFSYRCLGDGCSRIRTVHKAGIQ